jgi:hypothetical protein
VGIGACCCLDADRGAVAAVAASVVDDANADWLSLTPGTACKSISRPPFSTVPGLVILGRGKLRGGWLRTIFKWSCDVAAGLLMTMCESEEKVEWDLECEDLYGGEAVGAKPLGPGL